LEINNAWIELKAAQSDFSTAKEMFNEPAATIENSGVKR